MDEAEFQNKTQKFLKKMQELRKEIHEDVTTSEFEEEVVEELEVEERGYEETIQMADVKWQIPKHVVPKELPVERAEESIGAFPTERPTQQEIDSQVATADIIVRPSRVGTQETKMPSEAAADLYAEGAEMTEQREITVELCSSQGGTEAGIPC